MSKLLDKINKHSNDILLITGICGLMTTAVLATQAVNEAKDLIEERKKHLGVEKLGFKETVKCSWRCFVPAILVGGASTFAVAKSKKITDKRQAASVAACKMAERLGDECEKKLIETAGDKKAKEVLNDIYAEDMKKESKEKEHRDENTSRSGQQYFYDPYNQRFLWAKRDDILQAESYLKKLGDINISLADWLDAAKVDYDLESWENLDVIEPLSENVGWPDSSRIHVILSMAVTDKSGLPATVIRFDERPRSLDIYD